jgi:hypothetical protein
MVLQNEMMGLYNLFSKQYILIAIFTIPFCTQNSVLASQRIDLMSVSPETDSVQITKTIQSFLKWYKINYKNSVNFRLVGTDQNGYYYVDFKNCEKYLKNLKSSSYISEAYIKYWRKYFLEKDQNFKDNPQNEGPPEGFDYDLVTGTQEPDLLYNAGEKLIINILEATNIHAVAITKDIWDHRFTLSKQGKNWKIDHIELTGYTY